MEKTTFAGLSVLGPDDSLTADNSAFITRDRWEIDRGLQIGINTHRHDAASGLSNPTPVPSGQVVASGGAIPAGISLTLGYTLEDGSGGETELSPTVLVTTPSPLNVPAAAPTAAVSYVAGELDADTFAYAVTWIDGEGGETPVGPSVTATRDTGFANAQVELSGLNAGMVEAGAAAWRLYRARSGGEYVRLTEGTGAAYTDDGSVEPLCDAHPPTPNSNTTNDVSTLLFTLPGSAAIGQVSTWINLYASQAGDFAESCLLAQVPMGSAGHTLAFDSLDLLDAQPPDVNRSYDGAHQIDPDTELLDWHWKRPVSGSALLGSGAQGDVRLTKDKGLLYAVLGSAGAKAAPEWTAIGSGGVGGSGGVALTVRGSAVGSIQSAVATIEFPDATVTGSGAGKAVVTGLKGATGATGSAGAKGETGPAGAEGQEGLPVVKVAGNPGGATGTKAVSTTVVEGTINGKIGVEGTIDGVTMEVGDRFFYFVSGTNDGVYEVLSVGSAGSKWKVERVPGMNSGPELLRAAFIVKLGEIYKGQTYVNSNATAITLGTTVPTFSVLDSRDWGLVTVLPASPVVGDRCTYEANTGKGIFWQLIYDGVGEKPWKKIGGPPLLSKTTTENNTASTTYVTLANSPEITTPGVKMDANVRIGGRVINTGAAGFVFWTLFTSGGAEVAAAAFESNSGAPHGGSIFNSVALAASTIYTLRYKTSAGTTFAAHRFIEIDPIRVG